MRLTELDFGSALWSKRNVTKSLSPFLHAHRRAEKGFYKKQKYHQRWQLNYITTKCWSWSFTLPDIIPLH